MKRPATETPAAEPSAAEQPATLTDDELQDVAAGAASQIDYDTSLHQTWPGRTRPADWWRDDSATLTDGSSGGGIS